MRPTGCHSDSASGLFLYILYFRLLQLAPEVHGGATTGGSISVPTHDRGGGRGRRRRRSILDTINESYSDSIRLGICMPFQHIESSERRRLTVG